MSQQRLYVKYLGQWGPCFGRGYLVGAIYLIARPHNLQSVTYKLRTRVSLKRITQGPSIILNHFEVWEINKFNFPIVLISDLAGIYIFSRLFAKRNLINNLQRPIIV